MTNWKHDALAADLAAHLRGYARAAMCWTDMQLGPSGSQRPDVYTIEPTYTALRVMAYECKVSRADFLGDVGAGKALGYLRFAGAVVFATPKGMVKPSEVPEGSGLIERGDEAWRWARKPKINALDNLPWSVWMKLLIDGCGRELGGVYPKVRLANEWQQQERARKVLGDELGELYADKKRAEMMLRHELSQLNTQRDDRAEERRRRDQQYNEQRQAELDSVQRAIDEIAAELNLPVNTHWRTVIRALHEARPANDLQRLHDARRLLEHHAKSLTQAAEALPDVAA